MSYRSPLTILLIDDCAEARVAYCRFLQQNSLYTYRILEFETAAEAMKWCQQEIPDVVMLNFLLPDRKGLEFLGQFREHISNSQSAVIMLAGQEDADSAVHAMKSGAQDYLVKDKLTPEILQRSIHSAVERMHLTRQLEQSREQQQLMATIALRIRQSLKLDEILSVTATEVRQFLKADRVLVYQFHPDMSGTIVVESVLPGWTEVLGQLIQETYFQQGGATEYCQGRKQVIDDIYQAGLTICHLQLLEKLEVKANLVVPILVNDQLWGLLVAQQCSASRQWQSMELDLLDQLAVQIAIAIQQASTYEQLQTELAQRQHIEETLRQSEEQFRSTFEQVAVGMCHVSFNGHFLRFNQRFCDIAGYSQAELLTLTFQEITHPDDLAFDLEMMQNLLRGRIQTYSLEKRYIRKDRSLIWSTLTVSLVRDRFGEPQYLISVVEDITTRKQAEAALFQLAAIVESSEDAIISKTLDGVIVSWNAGAEKLFGYTAQEVIGQSIFLLIPTDHKNEESQILEKLKRGERVEHFETVRQRKDGTLVDISLTISPIKDATGKVIGASKIARDVSARKQAEEELRRSEKLRSELHLLENILEVSLAGYFDWDIPGDREYLSPTFKQMFGYEDHELANTPETWQHLIFPEDLLRLLECLDQHIKSYGQIPYYNEVRYRHKNGSTVWVICSGRVIEWDQDGNPLRMIGCHIDITERKQAEQDLKESEQRWQLALRGSNDGIWDWNYNTDQVFVSSRWKEMRGFADQDISDYIRCEQWSDAIHPDDRDRVLTALDNHLARKTPFFQSEYRVQCQDGSYLWILDRGQALWDEAGNAVRIAGSESDISDAYRQASQRKQIEQALKESEARYRAIVEDQTELIARFLPDTTIVFVNEAYCRYFGLQREEILGNSYEPVIFEEDQETVAQLLQSMSRENPTVTIENRVVVKGEIHWTQWINRMLFDEQGQFVELQSVGRDITDLKRIEATLKRYERIVSTAKDGIALLDRNYTYQVVNQAYLDWCNQSYSEVRGHSVRDILGLELFEQFIKPWLDRCLAGETVQYEKWFNYPNLVPQFLSVSYVPYLDAEQTIAGVVVSLRDITNLQRTEEALRISEERLKLALEGSGDGLWDWNIVTGEVYLNANWLEMLGYAGNELPHHHSTWERLVHPDDQPWVMEMLNAHLKDGSAAYSFDYRILTKSGEWKWVANYGKVVARDENGAPVRMVGTHKDISDRKQTEEALRILSERLTLALKSGGFGIWEYDFLLDKLIWDDRMYELYGVTPDNFVNTLTLDTWLNCLHPDDRDGVLETIQQLLQQDKDYNTEFRIIQPSGKIRFLKTYGILQCDQQGNPVRLVGINYDITDRKQAEQELEESRTMLQSVLDTIPQRVFWKDRQSRYLGCNPAFAHDYQLTPDTIIGKTDLELPWAKWASLYREDDAVVMNTGIPKLGYQEQTEGLNGEQLWLRTSKVPLSNSAGEVIGVLGSYEDITAGKQAQDELAKYAREVEDLYNKAPCGYHSLDIEGRFVNVNQTELDWLGYTREEMIGKPFTNFITAASQSVFEQNYPRFKERGWVKDLEYNMVCKDGTILPVLLSATAVKSAEGTYLYNRATLFDIRDRKRAQQELQELNTAMQNAVEGISRIDIDGRYVSVNRAYANLCGYEPEELIGQPWQQTVYSEDIPDLLAAYQQMLETGKVEAEARGIRKEGSLFYKQVTMVTIHDQEGTVTGHHCFMKDISDRKYAEAQLRQSNAELARATRMKDEFLANMSHELRTPLNAILGMSEGLQEAVFGAVNERQVKAIQIIERSGKHLLELINDILDLSKIESGKLELQISDVGVRSLCDGSLAFIKQMALKKNIHLGTHIPDNIGSIQADARRLRQLLINLLSNAVKFTPEDGTVTLEVRLEEAHEQGHVLPPSPPHPRTSSRCAITSSPSHLCFCVSDTGIGIAPENMGKLFQAFVQIDSRLNRQYTGTGLGLALVQSIAALHGGTVSVDSEVGRGSCFTVRIPYPSNREVQRMQVVTPCSNCSFPVDNAQVLIIEDSIAAAEQIARYLSECALQPIIYPHGEGAIEEVLRVKPALAILDIQLPNLSGWNILTQLKSHPQIRDIPVLIVSVVDERSKALALGASEYLVKPLNREVFQATLKKLQDPTVPESTTPMVLPEATSELPLILLAEDNQANIDTMSGYLESRGYRLILAKDGQQAVDLAKAQRPNLIVMDIQMPGMDGLEAMRRIRAEGQTDVPIIALTALAMPSDREKCIEAGANAYLSKPIKLKELAATIRKIILQINKNIS